MTSSRDTLDDTTAERLLSGRSVDGRPELEPLTTLVRALGGLETDPPAPRGHLAALLAAGFDPADAPAPADDVPVWGPRAPAGRRLLRHPVTRLAGLSLAGKVLLGGGVAVAGVTSAAGAGVLPGPVQDRVGAVVEAVTPFELPREEPAGDAVQPGDPGPGAPATERPSAPAGRPTQPPSAPAPVPSAAPQRTAPPASAGPPAQVPSRTARPEQAPPAPKPTGSGRTPSRSADPAPPAQQSPGREQAPGQQSVPPTAAPPAEGTGPTGQGRGRPEDPPADRAEAAPPGPGGRGLSRS